MNLTGMSIFATMSQLCRDNNAINLSQGCPDFDCDPELTELLTQAMKNGYNQYSPMEGILPLREGISEKYYNLYNVKYHPVTDITITAGATEAVFVAISSVVKKGDEVIVFEPAFDSYVPVIKLAGGIPVPVSLEYPDYKINWETVKNHISNKTKLIIINSPHNPTGTLLNSNDFAQLSKIVDENDIYILSDEVYEHIIFDGHQHESLALHPTLIPKSFIVGSFGKTFHTTGWRMGYCIAPPALSFEFRKVHQYVTFSAFTPAQYAIAEYIKNKDHYLQLPRFYEQKRNFFLELMKNSRFQFTPAKGTYFQLMSFENIDQTDDITFANWLVQKIKVASIPISPFYTFKNSTPVVRFCFAKKEETLINAAEKLCKI